MVQPWVDPAPAAEDQGGALAGRPGARSDPLGELLAEAQAELADLLLTGLVQVDHVRARIWADLEARAEAFGSTLLVEGLAALAEAMAARQSSVRWDWRPAAAGVLTLAAHLELARGLRM